MNDQKVANGFNQLAPFYDFLLSISFGKTILIAQTYFIDEIKSGNAVLIFGGGTGKILNYLQNIPNIEITYIDFSSKMIEKAQKRKGNCNIKFIVGSYNNLPEMKYDVIITPFVLDCFIDDELIEVVRKLTNHLKNNGLWMFSDFSCSKKYINTKIVKFLYSFFNVFCDLSLNNLPNFNAAFVANNLRLSAKSMFLNKLVVSEKWIRCS